MEKLERIGLITVDMEYATAEVSGDKKFFYGDNNSIEIKIENETEPIGDVCYFAVNAIGQVYAGTAVLTDEKYLIDKENMDCILNVVGEVIIQIQIFNTENQRITCTDTVSIESLLNYDRKKTEVLTPSIQVNLAELLEIAEKIANGEFDVTPESGTGEAGKDGVTFTPHVSSAGIISWTNDGGLANPAPVSIIGPQGPKGEAGENGKDGQDYVLTEADKQEIADIAYEQLSSELGDIGAILDEINGEVI